jgi:hypothetical protein
MARKTHPTFGSRGDMVTDYALIVTGVAAALIALIYLILI